MQPRPLHNRSDLIASLVAPTRACARAISEGRAEVLGGFTPPGGLPCYIVRVEGRHGSEWLLGLEVDEESRTFHPRRFESVPWASWDGRATGRSLKDGDDPQRYDGYRTTVRRSHANATDTAEAPQNQ